MMAAILTATVTTAATIWNGPQISYSQPAPDPTQAANRDQLTPNVSLTRGTPSGGGSGGMFNGASETFFTKFVSPVDTEWAVGAIADYASLSYSDWTTCGGGNPVHNLPGQQLVLHLISDDIYLSLQFTSLPAGPGFSYIRSTPAVANIPPAVTLTNPISNEVFPAVPPSTSVPVTIAASATDSDGTVTNVQFFDGAASLGNVAVNPYLISANLAIGSHALTAVATDNLGAATVSTAVTVTVVSNLAPAVTIVTPANGDFYTDPATIIVAASASSANSTVTNVEFFDNAAPLGHVAVSPYSLLSRLVVGAHTLKAVATDNLGTTNISSPITVTVTASNAIVNPPQFASIVLSNKFPSPPLTVANVPVIPNGLVNLRWQGDTRSKYDLLYTTNLANGATWTLAQPNIIGDRSGTNFLSDPPFMASSAFRPNATLYYRLNAMPPQNPGLAIRLDVIATNLVAPTVLTHAHDGSGRRFIADQTGQIWIVDSAGNLSATPFLDISNRMVALTPAYDERGLLGLAFHPNYTNNGRFFVYYSVPPPSTNFNNMTVLSEFKVSTNNPNLADPGSERVLLTINEPEFNHEGADIVFGPDGFLYLGPGDGGGAGDQHGATGNAQSLATLLGKILRLDVDNGTPYGIPSDNPFISTPGARPEIYAYGLRNPWRFSFDRGGTHQGFIADVGQNLWEELDLMRKGANYGWRILEGNHAFDTTVATTLGVDVPTLDYPIYEYGHGSSGSSIIGGFVYRGTNYPAMNGQYVFGDFSTSFGAPDGQLYYLSQTRPGIWERFPFQLWPNNTRLGRFIKGFGEDEAGEIYVLTSTVLGPTGRTGDVRKLGHP